jgi:hypothetical protein
MSYTAWSVVFGEQPTAAKWNQLGANDAGFKDGTNIDNDAILNRHLAAAIVSNAEMATDTWLWEKLADVTLASTGTSISSGTITARKHLRIITVVNPTGGTLNIGIRYNNDSGTNYAESGATNGGANATGTSLNQINTKTAIDANRQLTIGEIENESAQEKLAVMNTVARGSAGAGNAPERKQGVYKWANTAAQITRIDVVDTGGTGDIATGSRLIVLGHD